MNRVFLTLAIAFALTAAVVAGPESLPTSSGKEMKQVAPMPPPCPNWAGFYFGIQGGYAYADTDVHLHLDGFWENDPNEQPTDFWVPEKLAIEHQVKDLSTDGGSLGGMFGYNLQFNHWVVGAEAAGSYLWLRDSGNTGIFGSPITDNTYRIEESFKTHYLFTFGPRLGYEFCRWMPYVTGGLAVGDIDFHQNVIETNFAYQQNGSEDDTNLGWMVGAGLEYKLNNHWSVRAQYQYIDLDSVSFRSHGVSSDPTDVGFTGASSLDLREHHATVGVIFSF